MHNEPKLSSLRILFQLNSVGFDRTTKNYATFTMNQCFKLFRLKRILRTTAAIALYTIMSLMPFIMLQMDGCYDSLLFYLSTLIWCI